MITTNTAAALALGALVGIVGTLAYTHHMRSALTPLSTQNAYGQLNMEVEDRRAEWPARHEGDIDPAAYVQRRDETIEKWRLCVVDGLDKGMALATAKQRCGEPLAYR